MSYLQVAWQVFATLSLLVVLIAGVIEIVKVLLRS